jgi:hypothetical protein
LEEAEGIVVCDEVDKLPSLDCLTVISWIAVKTPASCRLEVAGNT